MPSLKQLAGVAHDIAHHAQSGLSWLHPHLGEACGSADVPCAEVELLEPQPYPAGLAVLPPLKLALMALQEKFWQIVESKGLDRASVTSVRLVFSFLVPDNHSPSVSSTITAATGKVFEAHLT